MAKNYALIVFVVIGFVTLISIPEAHAFDITLLQNSAAPGDSLKIVGIGFDFSHGFIVYIGSSPVQIGTGTTDSSGGFTTTVTIPLSTQLSTPLVQHRIIVTEGRNIATQPITIVSPQSIPEFPFPFSLVLVFVAVGAVYLVIRQKMIPNSNRY